MKNFKTTAAPGLFDVDFRLQWLVAKGNPLSRLDAVVDWELFRPLLDETLDKPANGPGGRPAHDRLKMFKALLVQRFDNLSDEQTEYPINDRLSFQQFIGWTLADKIPAAHTLWDFREALIEAGAFEKLFVLFDQQLRARGLLAHPGKLVDASFVDVPRQRHRREENATIKAGAVPEAWAEQPAKQRQKDVDARWTKKNAEVHYGDKNHVKADAHSKLLERYAVTDASAHDSQNGVNRRRGGRGSRLPERGDRSPAGAATGDQSHPRTRVPQPAAERGAERKQPAEVQDSRADRIPPGREANR